MKETNVRITCDRCGAELEKSIWSFSMVGDDLEIEDEGDLCSDCGADFRLWLEDGPDDADGDETPQGPRFYPFPLGEVEPGVFRGKSQMGPMKVLRITGFGGVLTSFKVDGVETLTGEMPLDRMDGFGAHLELPPGMEFEARVRAPSGTRNLVTLFCRLRDEMGPIV